MSEVITKEKPETNLYEVGYLVSPLVTEEAITATVDEVVRMAIEKAGGAVTGQTMPKRRALAYQVGKSINHKRTNFREAYFGAIRFEAMSDMMAEVKKSLDASDIVIRFIIINIPRRVEIPVVAKRVPVRRGKPTEKLPGDKPEITKEEIDKEIEGLLAPAA